LLNFDISAPGRAAALDAFQKKFTTPRRFMLVATIKEDHATGGLSLGLQDNAHTVSGSNEQMFGAK
jgi:hypothetical protein